MVDVFSGRVALVVSLLALVVALSGTAYAVATVRSADIVDGTIKTEDIGGGAVRTADIQNGAVGTIDIVTASLGHARRLWAGVNSLGTVSDSAGVSGATHDGTGLYTVTFTRNISSCAVSATPFDTVAFATYDNQSSTALNVLLHNAAGSPVDGAFDIIVIC